VNVALGKPFSPLGPGPPSVSGFQFSFITPGSPSSFSLVARGNHDVVNGDENTKYLATVVDGQVVSHARALPAQDSSTAANGDQANSDV
jgi:hypothetical protein